MDRRQLPPTAASPELPAIFSEIRLPERSTRCELRNREEGRA